MQTTRNLYRIFLPMILITLGLAGCGRTARDVPSSEEAASVEYTCPMRCENSASTQPGKCPVCQMLLVKSIALDSMVIRHGHSEQTIYTEDSWTDQSGRTLTLDECRGKYQLISTIFTNCAYACPNLIADMLNIDDDIHERQKERVDFLLVSIDPERDTPERLSKYADMMDLDTQRWKLLHGQVAAIDEVAARLGVSYKKFENGAFGHSNIISLLNPKGEVIYQLEGIHANREELVTLINQL